jgi:hypothetical protein
METLKRFVRLALLIPAALLVAAGALSAQPTDLPNWWTITNPTALNLGYSHVVSCPRSDYIRLKFWLPLGPNEPAPGAILDPVWGDIRLHTAMDPTWTTVYGGNHMDIAPGSYFLKAGGYQIVWTIDVPTLNTGNPFLYAQFSVRIINAWVDFEQFPGMGKVIYLSSQCRTIVCEEPPENDCPIKWFGIQRADLPPDPPVFPGSPCESHGTGTVLAPAER